MATKKVTRKVSPAKTRRPQATSDMMEETSMSSVDEVSSKKMSPVLYLVPVVIAIFAFVIWKNKGLIVAASVNNTPVWRWNLEQRFVSQYGNQTLEMMINEQILKNEVAKEGLTVSEADIKNKTAEIEKSLNGKITLKDALAQQGISMNDFKQKMEIEVMIDKLTEKKVSVSDKEVSDFIAQNKDTMSATDEAGMNAEAKSAILQTKKSQEFQKIFADLKKNAKVTKYL